MVVGIPAFNEERTIAKVVARTSKYAGRIAVVDDGSSDDTALIAEKLGVTLIRHYRNLGKGAAMRTLLNWAKEIKADALVTLDADAQHDPKDIPKLLEPVMNGKADIVIGARMERPSSMPRFRRAAQKSLDHLTNVKGPNGLLDSQSGFRAYSKKAIEMIEATEPGLGIDSQILMKASSHGLNIAQVPIEIYYDVGQSSKVSPLLQFSDVTSAIAREIFAKRPLRFLGIPGIILIAYGVYGWLEILATYTVTLEFATGHALLYTIVVLGGIFMVLGAIILFVVQLMIQEVRGKW